MSADTKPDKVRISVWIPEDLREALHLAKLRTGRHPGDLVAEGLRHVLELDQQKGDRHG